MAGFGDFDPDDALDHEPADPEQVARKLHRLRVANGLETVRWEELSEARRVAILLVVTGLLAWMRRQGAF